MTNEELLSRWSMVFRDKVQDLFEDIPVHMFVLVLPRGGSGDDAFIATDIPREQAMEILRTVGERITTAPPKRSGRQIAGEG